MFLLLAWRIKIELQVEPGVSTDHPGASVSGRLQPRGVAARRFQACQQSPSHGRQSHVEDAF